MSETRAALARYITALDRLNDPEDTDGTVDEFEAAVANLEAVARAALSGVPEGAAKGVGHRFDHDGTARHHHDVDTGEATWWLDCEQFGGERREHHGLDVIPPPVPSSEPLHVDRLRVTLDAAYCRSKHGGAHTDRPQGCGSWYVADMARDPELLALFLAAPQTVPEDET